MTATAESFVKLALNHSTALTGARAELAKTDSEILDLEMQLALARQRRDDQAYDIRAREVQLAGIRQIMQDMEDLETAQKRAESNGR